jgi:hypothetical protein
MTPAASFDRRPVLSLAGSSSTPNSPLSSFLADTEPGLLVAIAVRLLVEQSRYGRPALAPANDQDFAGEATRGSRRDLLRLSQRRIRVRALVVAIDFRIGRSSQDNPTREKTTVKKQVRPVLGRGRCRPE